MTTTALVPVFSGTLAGQPTQLCNARDLHGFLEVGDRFDQWISRRIETYGFADGEDFCTKLCKTRGRPATDYHLTLDTAKELAMVENNDKGRQVRRYFIQIEKEARKVGAGETAVPSMLNRRWLISFDHDGQERVTPVPNDACVMTIPQLLKAINEPNGLIVDTATLADFAVATIRRLQERCEFYQMQNRRLA